MRRAFARGTAPPAGPGRAPCGPTRARTHPPTPHFEQPGDLQNPRLLPRDPCPLPTPRRSHAHPSEPGRGGDDTRDPRGRPPARGLTHSPGTKRALSHPTPPTRGRRLRRPALSPAPSPYLCMAAGASVGTPRTAGPPRAPRFPPLRRPAARARARADGRGGIPPSTPVGGRRKARRELYFAARLSPRQPPPAGGGAVPTVPCARLRGGGDDDAGAAAGDGGRSARDKWRRRRRSPSL